MSNAPQLTKKMKTTTPVTIAPAKASLEKINKKVKFKYRNWLSVQNIQKHCLKEFEVISGGEEKAYKFQEQQKVAAAEAERWEKKKNEERQRQLQEKYQQLKHDREQQQQRKQKQQKKKQIQDDDDDTVTTEITHESLLARGGLECNLIDDEDDTHDNTIVLIPTQVLFRMNDTTLNWK